MHDSREDELQVFHWHCCSKEKPTFFSKKFKLELLLYTDNGNNSPVSYYRLKIVDNNAATTYSNTVVINKIVNNISKLTVYPNPATDLIHINIPEANSVVSIINSLGQVVKTIHTNQLNAMDLSIGNLSKGVYTIMVHNAANNYHQLFIKE